MDDLGKLIGKVVIVIAVIIFVVAGLVQEKSLLEMLRFAASCCSCGIPEALSELSPLRCNRHPKDAEKERIAEKGQALKLLARQR